MARIEVVMPQLGESIAEGTVLKWHKKVGEAVGKDETLLEIATDKVDSEIPSPAAGILAEILVGEQRTVPVNTVIAYLESEATGPRQAASRMSASPASGTTESPATPAKPTPKQPANRFYSPLVLNIAQTEGVSMTELEGIQGTGENGRVTKRDVLAFVDSRKPDATPTPPKEVAVPPPKVTVALPPQEAVTPPPKGTVTPSPRETVTPPSTETVAPPPRETPSPKPQGAEQPATSLQDLKAKYPPPDYEILQMSNVLQKMAQHMLTSVRTSPHVAAVHEVDMSAVVKHRQDHAVEFEKKEGFKLTLTPYIADAVIRALKKHPLLNSSVEGDKIIKKRVINLGLAVASENGLIVPVIKHAGEKTFTGLARAINDLANRTRAKKLTPDDIQGGTFTISNYGIFGTTLGTPVITQPQVAILGTGAVRKRPVVIDDAIAVRSIAFLTLSFDHRIIDGATGGMFMETVVNNLEHADIDMKL